MIYLLYVLVIITVFSLNLKKYKVLKLFRGNSFSPSYMIGNQIYNSLITVVQTREFKFTKKYKFYNSLIIQVMELSKSLGAPLLPIIAKVKKALLQDIKQEKELRSLKVNSVLTFVFSVLVTWFFLLFCKVSLNLNFGLTQLSLTALWQIFGVFSFFLVLNKLVDSSLGGFETLLEKIYIFDLSHSAGLCLSSILQNANFSALNIKKGDRQSIFLERLSVLIDSKQRYGMEITSDLELLVDEIWSSYALECEALKTKTSILKFIWLCIFFLSTYLFSLYSIFGQMIY